MAHKRPPPPAGSIRAGACACACVRLPLPLDLEPKPAFNICLLCSHPFTCLAGQPVGRTCTCLFLFLLLLLSPSTARISVVVCCWPATRSSPSSVRLPLIAAETSFERLKCNGQLNQLIQQSAGPGGRTGRSVCTQNRHCRCWSAKCEKNSTTDTVCARAPLNSRRPSCELCSQLARSSQPAASRRHQAGWLALGVSASNLQQTQKSAKVYTDFSSCVRARESESLALLWHLLAEAAAVAACKLPEPRVASRCSGGRLVSQSVAYSLTHSLTH